MKTVTPLRCFAALAAIVLVTACQDDAQPPGEAIAVPSGREVRLIDIITNAPGPAGATARFRFLAPGLTADDLEAIAGDMQSVCDSFAVGRIDGMVPAPQQIIISFADAATPFGAPAPDVVQLFESYRIENGACIWEVF